MKPNSPELKSFIPVEKDSDFPVQNLPYGVYSPKINPETLLWVLPLETRSLV